MTKLEKIDEILREYDSGADVDAEDVLNGIRNVLDDDRTYEKEHSASDALGSAVRIETPAGELCAYIGSDETNPSVGIYLVPKGSDGEIIDLAYAEVKGEELAKEDGVSLEDVSLYTYADPYHDNCTQKNVIKRSDVVKALEIEEKPVKPKTVERD